MSLIIINNILIDGKVGGIMRDSGQISKAIIRITKFILEILDLLSPKPKVTKVVNDFSAVNRMDGLSSISQSVDSRTASQSSVAIVMNGL